MATGEQVDESIFEDLPEGVSKGQAKQAWRARELIWRLTYEKTPMADIARTVRAPATAVEWVIQGRTGPAETSHTSTPDVGVGHPTPTRGVDEGGETPQSTEVPEGTMTGGGNPAAPAAKTPSGGGGTPRDIPPEQRQQMQAQLESLNLGDVGAPSGRSVFAGAVEMPDMYARLAEVCKLLGLQPEKAKGVAVAFAYQAKPTDLKKLHEIIIGVGAPPGQARTIVDTYRSMNTSLFDGGAAPPDAGTASLEELERRFGIRPAASGAESEVDRLDREERQLRIQEVKLAIEEKRKSLGLAPGAAAGSGDEGTIEVMINVNGVPVPKRIKESDLPRWQPFMARPPGQAADAEVPAWAKALQDQNKLLQDRLERQDRERDEERRRREEEERLDRRLSPLLEEVKALRAGNPQDSDVVRELKALREDRERRRDEDLRGWQGRMEDLVKTGMSVDAAERKVREEDDRAVRRGFVPRGQVGRLEEEQVQLEAERKANEIQNNAKAKAYDVVAARVGEQPLMTMAREARLPQIAGEVLKQRVGGAPENQGELVEQSPEHLQRAAAELEGIAGAGQATAGRARTEQTGTTQGR
ncbi:MAG: hypothetical protein IVW52_05155 [Acidimicrobiales bacterium]|nr:hypothetical protein [Acidimicrobiales bacterium]